MTFFLCVLSAVLGGLRVFGVTASAYQAVAHCYVGGLFGAALVGFLQPTGHRPAGRWLHLGLAVALTVLETVCFFYGTR